MLPPCCKAYTAPAGPPAPLQVLLNKVALSQFQFHSANSLLLFQCFVCVFSVKLCEALGVVRNVEPLRWKVVRVWLPVNLIFVGMIGAYKCTACAARLCRCRLRLAVQLAWFAAALAILEVYQRGHILLLVVVHIPLSASF